jgi:hypothetical protein
MLMGYLRTFKCNNGAKCDVIGSFGSGKASGLAEAIYLLLIRLLA